MKRIVLITIVLCLCWSLCSCNSTKNCDEFIDDEGNATVQNKTNNDDVPAISPRYVTLYYDSLLDLTNSIEKSKEESFYSDWELSMTDEELNGFKAFMKRFQDKIIIPYVNGEVTEFVYKEGYSIASIYPKESYDLPCIVYHPKVAEDTSVSLRFTFIPNEILENFEDPTAFEVVEKLSPNSPEIGYSGKDISSVYNKELQLGDRKVIALIYEYPDSEAISTIFVYDDLLVHVRGTIEKQSNEWFATLSFGEYKG